MSVIAIPKGRQQHDLCCCTWDFREPWTRTYTHPECTTHGSKHVRENARQEKIASLRQRRSEARQNIATLEKDLVLLPGRIASQKRLVETLSELLRELGE